MHTRHSSRRAQRGSVLLTALLFSLIIGIALTSYLQLSRTGMQISNRALYLNASMNLAENGLEEAMYAINKKLADPAYDWAANGWTISGTDAYKKWTGTNLDSIATGETRAYVYNYASSTAPKVVARSVVRLNGSSTQTLEKWIEVRLRKTSIFANGLVAKDSIAFSGNNASVNSWNSDPSGTGSPIEGYDPTPGTGNKNDNGSVGSISVSVNAVLVQNADIWGYAATGGALPVVGNNGLVGPFGTSTGTMDMSHVSTDFAASFDPVEAPAGSYTPFGGSNVIGTISLPRGTDPVSADGYYYISADSMGGSNQVITITDKVVLKLTNTSSAIDIKGGSGELRITGTGELKIYTAGSVSIAGKGLMNGGTTAGTANQPVKCQIYGTKTSGSQDIQIAGNGILSAVVYAPFGSVKINGNGDVCGSVVANDITCVGNAAFHYDESLANFGGNNPFRVSLWKELTSAADRATYSAALTF